MKTFYKALFAMFSFFMNVAYQFEQVWAAMTYQEVGGYDYNCCSSARCTSSQIIVLGSSGIYSGFDYVRVYYSGVSGFCSSGMSSCTSANWYNSYYTYCSGISGMCGESAYLTGNSCARCASYMYAIASSGYHRNNSCVYCSAGYYRDYNSCFRCPSGGSVWGSVYGTTSVRNSGTSANCFLVSGMVFNDATGSGTAISNCYYSM
ncbi:MAG: hypothetical protein ACLRFO_02915 [Alphaproteobacteria bacterium]